jgi:hypothetical protein
MAGGFMTLKSESLGELQTNETKIELLERVLFKPRMAGHEWLLHSN